jgi:acetolactate synthase-1/2/3 large subunit
MLVLTPQVSLVKEGRGALQDSSMDGYDLARIFAECTRFSSVITHPTQLATKLARALSLALSAPSGPVHLSIPSDILAGSALGAPESSRPSPAIPQPVDVAGVDALVSAVLQARAPLFYVGDDAGPGASGSCELARLLGGSVITSPAGKRWIGHRDSAYKGVLGFSGHPGALTAVRSAEVIVALGATFDELSTNAWAAIPPDVQLYSLDRHAQHAYRMPSARAVIGDIAHIVRAIRARLPANRIVPRISETVNAEPPSRPASDHPVHPADLMRWLSDNLPDDVVVHVDAGNSFSWTTRELVRTRPDTYRVAMGLSTMCWAIGAAVGAAVGRRRRTVCICGDGSMLMSSLELTVAVEQHLPITYVVLNDSSLGMVRHGQRLSGAESIAHQITPVRFGLLARACGAKGTTIRCVSDLDAVDRSWLGSDDCGPAVIDVIIDRDATPPIADRVLGLAAGVSR